LHTLAPLHVKGITSCHERLGYTARTLSSLKVNKCLANAKRPCGCSVLCLCPKSPLCSCPYSRHYGRIVVFSLSLTVQTS